MTNPGCGWREEEVVDLMLGRLPADYLRPLQRHIPQCGRCGELLREWERLLPADGSFQFPSAAVKHKLKNRYSLGQGFASFRYGSEAVFAWSGAFAVFLLVLGLFSLRDHAFTPALAVNGGFPVHQGMTRVIASQDRTPGFLPEQERTAGFFPARNGAAGFLPGILPERDETGKHLYVVMNPQTVQYSIVQPDRPEVRGYVWVNKVSDEVLIMVEGLESDERKDYQAWFITAHNRLNGGIMHWQDGRAHLYAKGVHIQLADHLAVSQEPKGGSVRPTGPETFLVQLQNAGN